MCRKIEPVECLPQRALTMRAGSIFLLVAITAAFSNEITISTNIQNIHLLRDGDDPARLPAWPKAGSAPRSTGRTFRH
jgi:hypothetical protein